ncbi:hypothetical protein AAH979_18410 [Plantactinospora sp. ZYX-F-223]|uniref:hypothetical protein n=1 Tax=Plantactinospora sp. ZYX-F-223 TaxID=3144103 RepID=UPI0031FD0AB9
MDDELVMFSKQIHGDIHAELGLDIIGKDFGLSLNPVLSVRHTGVSNLVAQFYGFDRGPSAVGASLSDILRAAGQGSGILWTVEERSEVPAAVAKILSDVHQYGSSFYSRHSSIADLIKALEAAAITSLNSAQLAVSYMVAGQIPEALSILRRLEHLSETQPALLARQTVRFVSSFREHFNVEGK